MTTMKLSQVPADRVCFNCTFEACQQGFVVKFPNTPETLWVEGGWCRTQMLQHCYVVLTYQTLLCRMRFTCHIQTWVCLAWSWKHNYLMVWFYYFLHAAAIADIYNIAFQSPNLLQRLVLSVADFCCCQTTTRPTLPSGMPSHTALTLELLEPTCLQKTIFVPSFEFKICDQ